jgi:hypothetical protein
MDNNNLTQFLIKFLERLVFYRMDDPDEIDINYYESKAVSIYIKYIRPNRQLNIVLNDNNYTYLFETNKISRHKFKTDIQFIDELDADLIEILGEFR